MSHFVLTTPPTQGHVRPALRLAEALVNASDAHVTVLLPAVQQPTVPTPTNPRLSLLYVPIPADVCGCNVGKAWRWLDLNKVNVITFVCTHVCQPPVTAVILDQFSVWSFDLAAHLDVPAFVFVPSPLTYLYLAMEKEKALQLGDSKDLDRCLTLQGLGDFGLRQLPLVHTTRDSWHYDWIQHFFQHYDLASGFLVNDVEALYPDFTDACRKLLMTKWQAPLWTIGPITSEGAAVPDRQIVDFLDSHKDVLYIAFGSWCVMPLDHLTRFCEGLEKSNRPFIWAYRPWNPKYWVEILPDDEQQRLLPADPSTVEADGLPKGFRARIADRGLILPWVSQTAILQHPKISVFVTHCGWNSTLEALVAPRVGAEALTFLCVPLAAEQSLNASIICDIWHCGIAVYSGGNSCEQQEAPDPQQIVDALDLLVCDPQYRARTGVLSNKVQKAAELNSSAALKDFSQYTSKYNRLPIDDAYCVGLP